MSTPRRWLGRLAIGAAIVAAFAIGLSMRGAPPSHDDHADAAQVEIWTCSMHPQIQLPESGACPICGMDLIPLTTSAGDDSGPRTLTLSPSARAIAEIQTSPVEQRSVSTPLRMVGKLESDETRVREIAARVGGRIDRLYVDYTGESVRRGQKLFDIFSPEIYSAQEELLQAVRASATRLADAARERLRLWGLTPAQIQSIEERGSASEYVTIVAPISGIVVGKNAVEGSYVKTGAHVFEIADLSMLWLKLDAYESDLAWIRTDQVVQFTTATYGDEAFEGTVSFIDPVLDPTSRSVKVRVNVANTDSRLKPGMFARAVVQAVVDGEDGELPLVIPKTAALVTGTRAIVYVEDPREPGRYDGREVKLGTSAGDWVVVLDGLSVGESVVSNGSFKIDSALQILAKKSMMNPDGGGAPPGHDHGDGSHETISGAAPAAGSGEMEAIAGIPPEFLETLDPILSLYIDVSTALSQDDLETARGAAIRIPDATSTPNHGVLPPDGHEPWGEISAALSEAARGIGDAADIATARHAFHDLSVAALHMVHRFGVSGNTPLYVYHCPMAMDGAGADWLQSKRGTENPYYGSMMFSCGSETRNLTAGGE
jgi:Cu(I)/Ag(I) efflux system membrane fusion protein